MRLKLTDTGAEHDSTVLSLLFRYLETKHVFATEAAWMAVCRSDPIIKSNIPRALTKCDLQDSHKQRIRTRVLQMLGRSFMPKEFRQYAWLLRRFGLLQLDPALEAQFDRTNLWVVWYLEYLTSPSPQGPPCCPWARRDETEMEQAE